MRTKALHFAVTCVAATTSWLAAAASETAAPHPWCPPFGHARVGLGGSSLEFEADASTRVDPIANPIDLGTILVPNGWLLVGPGQAATVDVAAISRKRDELHTRLRAWFASDPQNTVSLPFSIPVNERVQRQLQLPSMPPKVDRDELHVAIERLNGNVVWKKIIPAMFVRQPPKWPKFGASATKLRYDAPISVRKEDGTFATLEYTEGWNPRLDDVVVSLPNGSRFVFWRGSSYVPFWAGKRNTGVCYEWAETASPPDGFTDSVEPLMDKELRYGRVEIVESTAARVHVRWTYQSCDFNYKTWGDSAVEDFYFYPDGFGTRVLTLQSALDSNYELSEFIILTPQDAYPLDVLPKNLVDILFLDGEKREIDFPYDATQQGAKLQSRDQPAVYRVRFHKDDPTTAIYFHAQDRRLPPIVFGPFMDRGRVVTPCYWGSHWPLARGQTTGGAINDRIHATPAHNSVMSWGTMQRPPAVREARLQTIDTLGRPKQMQVQTWVWLIGLTDAADARVLEWAESFGSPPSLERLVGARLESESFVPERRAIRFIAESPSIELSLHPTDVCVDPVFEIRNATGRLSRVTMNGALLDTQDYAWDGQTLWLNAILREPVSLRFEFAK
jgi:hypothetical protein